MPNFTMELWRVIELKPDDKSEDEWLGLSDYPLIEGDYREVLNTKIKNHYMYQEIGLETVEQFSFAMRRKMHEIMPFYNELYRTTKLQFDPLSTMDIKTVSSGVQAQTSEGSSTSEAGSDVDAVSKNVTSSFPQTMLAGDKDYATSGADSNSQTKTEATTNEESSAESSATSESSSHTSGFQGPASQLLMQYRATILNVDMLIVAELDDLFMLTWGNSDEYTRTTGRFYNDYFA